MKEKAIDRLIELHDTLDTQTKKFAELRNELIKKKSFALAHDLYKIEEHVHAIQSSTCRLLKELTIEKSEIQWIRK